MNSSLASVIVEHLPCDDAHSDDHFKILDYNTAFVNEFVSDDSIDGNLNDTLLPKYQPLCQRLTRAVKLRRKHIRIVLPEHQKTLEIELSPLLDNLYSIVINDVTEEAEDLRLQLMKQALEKSKKQYELLFTEMKNIFVSFKILSLEHGQLQIDFSDANPAFEHLFKRKKDEFIGESAIESPLLKDTMLLANVEFVFDSGIPVHYQERNVAMGCYLDVSLYKLDDQTVALVASDVTELKKAEIALKASEERYRSLLETADDRIAVFTSDLELKFANPSFYTKLGYDSSNYPVGKEQIKQLFFEPEKLEEIIKHHEVNDHMQFEYQVRHKQGHLLTMHAYLQPLNMKDAEKEILLVSRDITQLKENERRLKIAKDKAEESDRLKSSFLANMSHEIRTPLNGILGFSKLLSRPNLTEEKRQHYINLIDNNGTHLLSIISDILDIAKIESNQLEVNFSQVDLNEQFDSLLAMSNTIANIKDNAGVTISVSKGIVSSEAVIETDAMRLTQIMRNLIENALKFTNEGTVNFGYKLHDDGTSVYFYVKDTGIGIADDKQEIVFEHFRQEDETITRKYGGTGLGLSICRHLVRRLGGELYVESDKGKGAKFYFCLPYNKPVTEDRSSSVSESNIQKSGLPASLKFACCVSDEMTKQLSSLDLPVNFTFCSTFSELLECAESKEFNGLILDFIASKPQAADLVRKIKDSQPFLPVFAAIERKEDQDTVYYSKVGFNDVIDLQTNADTFVPLLKFYFELP